MKNIKRIAMLEVCCVNLIDQVRDIEERIKCAEEQPAPSVHYVMKATNPANAALDVTIDAEGVATHHCDTMPEHTMLRYHETYKAWLVDQYGVSKFFADFCPCCGSDFRDVTISKAKYVYNMIDQICPHCLAPFSTPICPCQRW